jgi:hypothetical protein
MTEIHGDPAREIIESALAPNLSRWVSGDVANRILEALRSRGYAIVPIEPTERMVKAGDGQWDWPVNYARATWRVMIEATIAPSTIQSAAPPKDT